MGEKCCATSSTRRRKCQRMPRPVCAAVGAHRPLCFPQFASSTHVLAIDGFACRLPYNMPGVPDALRPNPSPLLPPLLVPPPTPCARQSNVEPSLLVWRSRWPHNFMVFIYRVLVAAPSLLALPRPALVFVPAMPAALPAFYRDVLGPLGKVVTSAHGAFLRGRAFNTGTLCCANSGSKLNRTAAEALIAFIRRHHLGPLAEGAPSANALAAAAAAARARGKPSLPWLAFASSSTSRALVSFVDRAPTQQPSEPSVARLTGPRRSHASRAITNAEKLLDECSRSAAAADSPTSSRASECARLKLPPEVPFAKALAALGETTVLVGVHGAGLANAVFLPAGASVVEILPKGFSAPGSFAVTPDKYGWLRELGLRRVRLVAKETMPNECASVHERARQQWERLRDCDVTVSWAEVEAALEQREPEPKPSTKAEAEWVNGTAVWRCTSWPAGSSSTWLDAARCLHGNRLRNGYEYVHNVHRGMATAKCGACTCCRRPRDTPSEFVWSASSTVFRAPSDHR